jgi:hypothetical protein
VTAVRLPGGHFSPTVKEAPDAALQECLAADQEALRAILTDDDAKPTAEGLIPEEWRERNRRIRANHHNLAAAERIEWRIVAIQDELRDRENARIKQAQIDKAEAKAGLGNLLVEMPGKAVELQQIAVEVIPAAERMRQFMRDVEEFAGAVRLPEFHAAVKRAASVAAEALSKPEPEIPELPDGLPTAGEVDRLLAIVSGRHGGFNYLGNAGRANKAEVFARKLK